MEILVNVGMLTSCCCLKCARKRFKNKTVSFSPRAGEKVRDEGGPSAI